MARPKSDTVTYFPHFADASSKKTLTIMEGKFGVAGYAFWFKLLEQLCSHEGHYIDCRNNTDWQYLTVKLGSNEVITGNILDTLANLDAIDAELWEKKIIWSNNFIKNISDAYANRNRPTPNKPIINTDNSITTLNIPPTYPINTPTNSITTPENPYTILNDIKLNKTKLDNISSSISFEEYVEQIKIEFNDLDVSSELKGFNLYWSEGNRKLKRPKSAFRNWLINARKYKSENNGNGHKQIQQTERVVKYTKFDDKDPEYLKWLAKRTKV
jgi:hypothetical protein